MRLPLSAALTLALLAPPASAQGLPPALQAFADDQAAACREAGGEPRIGPAFATAVDLDGEGRLDYIVDLAGLECAGAWSYFCGSAGCPVSVWLAGPEGHARVWGDYAQGWEIVGAGVETALLVHQHGAACPGNTSGAEPCSQRLAFAAGAVAGATDAVDDAAKVPVTGVALPEPEAAGWSLRAVPEGDPVAVATGPGLAERLAVFCLGGRPWLAVTLEGGPGPATLTVDFTFARAGATAGGEARSEDGAGGAYVLDLTDGVLARLLAGADAEAGLAIAGTDQGALSLRGSTRAIRGALAPCFAL